MDDRKRILMVIERIGCYVPQPLTCEERKRIVERSLDDRFTVKL